MRAMFLAPLVVTNLIAVCAHASNTPPKGERAELGAVIYKYSMGDTVTVQVQPNQQVICDTCPKTMRLAEYRAPVVSRLKLNEYTPPKEGQEDVGTPVREIEIKQPQGQEPTERLVGTIRFKLDSARLDRAAEKQVAALAAEIKASSGEVFIGIDGYTCRLGSKKHNDKLAKRRADAVAKSLAKHGIKVARVNGTGVCCYVDGKNLAPNRRVEIHEQTRKGGVE